MTLIFIAYFCGHFASMIESVSEIKRNDGYLRDFETTKSTLASLVQLARDTTAECALGYHTVAAAAAATAARSNGTASNGATYTVETHMVRGCFLKLYLGFRNLPLDSTFNSRCLHVCPAHDLSYHRF